MNALRVDSVHIAPAAHVYCDASAGDGTAGLQVTPLLRSQELVQGSKDKRISKDKSPSVWFLFCDVTYWTFQSIRTTN